MIQNDSFACTSLQSNQLEKWNNKSLKNKTSKLTLPWPSLVRGPQPSPFSSSTIPIRIYGNRPLLAGRSEPKHSLGLLLYFALRHHTWPQPRTHLVSVMSRIASMFIADMPRRSVRRMPSSISLCRAFSCRFANCETHHAATGYPADATTVVGVHHQSQSETFPRRTEMITIAYDDLVRSPTRFNRHTLPFRPKI